MDFEDEKKLNEIFNSIPIGIMLVDSQTHIIVNVNRTAKELIGSPKDKIVGKKCREFICLPNHVNVDYCPISDLKRLSDQSERILLDINGNRIPIFKSVTPIIISGKELYLESFADISEIRKTEERLSLATAVGGIGVWDWDFKNNNLIWDDSMYELYGIKKGDFPDLHKAWEKNLHPDDRDRIQEEIQKGLKGKKVNETSFRIITPKGEEKFIKSNAKVYFDNKGNPVRVIGINMDITAEEKVKEELATLAMVAQNTQNGIVITNANEKIEWVNDSYSRMTGYSFKELLGENPGKLLHGRETDPNTKKKIREALNQLKPVKAEIINYTKKGTKCWMEVFIKPVLNEQRQLQKYIAITNDINEKKIIDMVNHTTIELAEQAGLYSSDYLINHLLEESVKYTNSNVGFFYSLNHDQETVSVRFWKQHSIAERIFKPSENLSKKGIDIWQKSFKENKSLIVNDNLGIIEGKKLFKKNWKLSRFMTVPLSDKEKAVAIIGVGNKSTNYSEFDLKILGILAKNSWNIIKRKQVEEELIKLNEELEERVKKRTQQLEKAKETADIANRAKSEFLANMSHEIRTPLNAIMGLTYLTLQTNLSEKQQDYVKNIRISSNSLLSLINDILDLSKIEAGRLEIEHIHFNLNVVLENLSNMIGMQVQEKGLEFVFKISKNVPVKLIGDPLRLGQILLNLVSNAIKFTKMGQIVVSINLQEKKQERVRLQFSISDTGIGITQDHMAGLFKAFTQGDSSITRKHGGTGLGLTISKHLVEMMGGEMQITSKVGEGSTFKFSIEFDLQTRDRRQYRLPCVQLKGLHIIVIDKNKVARESLEEYLDAFSFKVKSVESVEQLISGTSNNWAEEYKKYQLFLIDWQTIGKEGLEKLKRILIFNQKNDKHVIIMIPAYGQERIIKEAEKTKPDDILVKPFGQEILFNSILKVIQGDYRSPKDQKISIFQLEKEMKGLKGSRILLVEDNEINCMIAEEILLKKGFQVSTVLNGEEAVKRVTQSDEVFDLVLMDLHMPAMDGYEATRQIRRDERFSDLPIIAMTADAMSGVQEHTREAGMNACITKPVDVNQMLSTVVRWLESKMNERLKLTMDKKKPAEKKSIGNSLLMGIDMESALERLNQNQTLYKKLLEKFYKSNNQFVEKCIELLSNGKQSDAERLVHTLKGVAGTIGAKHLQTNAATLQKLIKDNATETEMFQYLNTEMTHALKEVLISINEFIEGKL